MSVMVYSAINYTAVGLRFAGSDNWIHVRNKMTILVIQLALFSLVMAHEPSAKNNFLDGWWFHVSPERTSFKSSSFPCLLRSARAERRDDYTYTPGFSGYKLHTQAAIWNEARKICKEEGAHLAIVNSVAEADVICKIFKNTKPFINGTRDPLQAIIGFHDLFGEGEFVTIHDQSLYEAGFYRWGAGSNPSNTDGVEHCGTISKFGELNDVPCGDKFGFICELPN